MKSVIIVTWLCVTLLLFAGAAWADTLAVPPDCLAKMEAAMRAMEEFTPKPFELTDMIVTEPAVMNYCPWDRTCLAERALREAQEHWEQAKRRDKAMSHWVAVKRECWREP